MVRFLYPALLGLALLTGGFHVDAQAQTLPGPSPMAQVPNGGTVAPPSVGSATASLPPAAAAAAAQSALEQGYQLGTGDKMKISVYGEEDMSGEFVVDGSGQIQFPLLGQVHAAGLTASQFAAALTASLAANYLRDPKVSIQIENYRPFYIMGEVNRPGEYPYENSLSALGAIALAGGYTYRANDTKVYIRRSGSAKEEVFPMSNTTIIYPGDVMRIVERFF